MKIGIIGAGLIGKEHADCILSTPGCSLSAVADIDIEKANVLAALSGAASYSDYRKMCTEQPLDAVIVNLPHYLHVPCGEFCLRQGISVLMEKPMAISAAQCDVLIRAAKESGSKLAVGHPQRYFAVNQKVRSIVQSGELGRLCMIQETRNQDYFSNWRPRWFLDKNLSGGGIAINLASHALDKFLYISGKQIADVVSGGFHGKEGYNVEAGIQMLVKFEENLSAAITCSGYQTPYYYLTAYYFERGAVHVQGTDNMYLSDGNDMRQVPMVQEKPALALELEDFLRFARGEPSDIPTPQYAKNIVQTIEKAYRQ